MFFNGILFYLNVFRSKAQVDAVHMSENLLCICFLGGLYDAH